MSKLTFIIAEDFQNHYYTPSFPYLSKDYEAPNPLPSFEHYKTPYTPEYLLNKNLNQQQVVENNYQLNYQTEVPTDLGYKIFTKFMCL